MAISGRPTNQRASAVNDGVEVVRSPGLGLGEEPVENRQRLVPPTARVGHLGVDLAHPPYLVIRRIPLEVRLQLQKRLLGFFEATEIDLSRRLVVQRRLQLLVEPHLGGQRDRLRKIGEALVVPQRNLRVRAQIEEPDLLREEPEPLGVGQHLVRLFDHGLEAAVESLPSDGPGEGADARGGILAVAHEAESKLPIGIVVVEVTDQPVDARGDYGCLAGDFRFRPGREALDACLHQIEPGPVAVEACLSAPKLDGGELRIRLGPEPERLLVEAGRRAPRLERRRALARVA